MCQPKPGPRCSGHTREALVKAETQFAEAESLLQDAEKTHLSQGTAEQKRVYNSHLNKYRTLQSRFHRAQRRYDATPEGLERLKEAQKEGQQAASKLRDTIEAERRNPLERKEAVAELRSTLDKNSEVADRYDRARTRRQFERQALQHRKERAEEIKNLEALAQTGNVAEMRASLDKYMRNTIPVHIDSQIDEEPDPQMSLRGTAYSPLVSTKRTFKATTADGGKVDIEVEEEQGRGDDGSSFSRYKVTPKFKAQKNDAQWYGQGGFGNFGREAEPQTYETTIANDSPDTAAHQIATQDTRVLIKNLAAEAVVEQSKRENLAHARILLGECLRQQRRNIQDRLARGE